jgi:hypothetical protein
MAGDSKEAVEFMAKLMDEVREQPTTQHARDCWAASNMLLRLLAQRDAEARAGFERALKLAAMHARCQFDDRSRMRSENIDWNDAYDQATRDVEKRILALLAPAAIDEGTQR